MAPPSPCGPPSQRQPTAGLVIIGNEVLSAKVVDANTPLLLQRVNEAGIRVAEVAIVPDEVPRIASVLKDFSARFELVITTGGVGPTHDDCTWKAVAEAFEQQMELHSDLVARIRAKIGHPLTAEQERLAWLPRDTQLSEPDGRWPLLHYKNVYVLPGVPSMVAGRIDQVLARLRCERPALLTVYLAVEEWSHVPQIDAVVAAFGDLDIGSYPIFDGSDHRLRVTLEGYDRERIAQAADLLASSIGREHVVRLLWREAQP